MSVPAFAMIAKYRKEAAKPKTIVVEHDLIGRHGRIAKEVISAIYCLKMTSPLKVLDIGAYDKALKKSLEKCKLPNVYHSLDIDTCEVHDFQNIKEVTEKYHVICMFEFIEHLTLEEVCQLFQDVYKLLEPGGKAFISTPNPFHSTRFFSDVTHKQHWPSSDLYAVLRHVGFAYDEIELYGVVYRDSLSLSNFPRAVVRRLRDLAWRLLGLDIRGGILAITTKREI